MPKAGAQKREDEALALVCAALSHDGRSLVIDSRPDRGTPSALTVDALIKVTEGERSSLWAADVCLASSKFDDRIPRAMNSLRPVLLPRLEDLAQKVRRSVTIGCRAYVRFEGVSKKEWDQMMREYERNVFDRALVALTRPDQSWYDAEVSIHWQQSEYYITGERVYLKFQDPFIHEGFRFARAVHKKLNNQMKRARELGYPTLLVLDQKPPTYVDWIINEAPLPEDIGEVLAFLIAHYKTKLDACVLLEHDDSVHEVYGRITA